jgi:hypothetical protein
VPDADIVDGRIAVRTQYHERHLVQQVPGARYDKGAGHWTVPLSWASCVILRGLFEQRLEIGSNLAAWSWQIYEARIEPATQLRNAMELSPDDPVAKIIDLVESRMEGGG